MCFDNTVAGQTACSHRTILLFRSRLVNAIIIRRYESPHVQETHHPRLVRPRLATASDFPRTYMCETFRPDRRRRADVTTVNRAPPLPPARSFSFHNKEQLKRAASQTEQPTASRTSTNTRSERLIQTRPKLSVFYSLNDSHITADCLGSSYKLAK